MWLNNLLLNGKTVSIETENGKIKTVSEKPSPEGGDFSGLEVHPGLIDVHTHGCIGLDTMDADFAPMCRFLADAGTTAFLPTTMTMGLDDLKRVTKAETKLSGAQILGFHFEGPYISPQKKGAQNEKFIRTPDYDEFRSFENVKMITVAPEISGAIEFIKKASKNCIVSIGHTCATAEQTAAAIKAGACCLTHMYNAMPPFNHRETGPIGAAFVNRIYSQIICDGVHISREAVLAAYRLFGADRLVLISDSIRPAGLPDGQYESGGLTVILNNNEARLIDGTLAGSAATLLDCVKKAVEFGIPKKDAIRMASATPAEMLGANKGKIKQGFDADLIITDSALNLKAVMIAGKMI